MKTALFLAGLFLAGSSWANIGSVTESSGTAIIKRGKETIAVAKGTAIEINDKVETKNGRVKIVFKDDTNVTVTESSSLIIDDFVYDPKSGAGKLGLKAAAGTVRYVSGSIAKDPKNVKINTPTAAIAVRGTDFVMAVSETGASMVMLMPSCEIEQNVNLKGLTCGSGAIDVETPAGIVKMNRPFQATLVETMNAMPSPPITVNLSGSPIGNNLMINPPRTMSGMNIISAARAAAEKTGDAKKDDKKDRREDGKEDKDDKGHHEEKTAKDQQERNRQGQSEQAASEDDSRRKQLLVKDNAGTDVGDTSKENPYVKKIWKDKSETQQIGWQYESLSTNENNYTSITLPIDSKALVIVTQDRQTNAFNFNLQSSKSYGMIVINQNFR
jgi:hypothetical protein